MRTRLVEQTECVHGYFGLCTFGDCPGGTSREVEGSETPWSKRAVVGVRNRLGTPTTTDGLRAFVMECAVEAKRIDAWEAEEV